MKIRWALIGVMALGLGCHESHEGSEKDEVKMTLSETPPAVREGLTREAGGAPIDKVDKEMKDGKTIYEIDVKSNGKTWEIQVDENGKLVSKKEEKD